MMEDLWKVTRIDYRISSLSEAAAYEELLRRYHVEEDVKEKTSPLVPVDHHPLSGQE